MTANEKADELIEKFYSLLNYRILDDSSEYKYATRCAIIAVEEILNLPIGWADIQLHKKEPEIWSIESTEEFWNDVLTELKAIK